MGKCFYTIIGIILEWFSIVHHRSLQQMLCAVRPFLSCDFLLLGLFLFTTSVRSEWVAYSRGTDRLMSCYWYDFNICSPTFTVQIVSYENNPIILQPVNISPHNYTLMMQIIDISLTSIFLFFVITK